MNQSLLSIGIVLSIGSIGCAGLGVQHASSLTDQFSAERGVDDLWGVSQKTPSQGAEAPLYAEQELGTLWDSARKAPAGVLETGYDEDRGGDLWNPASVTRSWEPSQGPPSRAYRFGNSSPQLPRF